jgi:tRNA-2-methylthio-N6-dimethylallyladenosine synthase
MADAVRLLRSEITDRPDDADVILFNTCSVREKVQSAFFTISAECATKALNPALVIGVGGRVASQKRGDRQARTYVDVVFGPQTLHRLPDLIARRRATASRRWT